MGAAGASKFMLTVGAHFGASVRGRSRCLAPRRGRAYRLLGGACARALLKEGDEIFH
jgi:hypothetical protein